MERNAEYLLSLDPDRLLHNTRKYAGLKPKGELYGGWEARGIAGHTLGHYLTALSQQFAATGDVRFRERIDYIVKEMAECQNAYGDGYIGALPPTELATLRHFANGVVEPVSAFNFKGGAWVPWYTQHKVLTGLVDAWVLGGSEPAKTVALKLADWVDSITSTLTPAQQQKMLEVEHGGMLETLLHIYALTGDGKYLEASRRFYHKAILDPLAAGRDELNGKHANTQIPKIIGAARDYEVTGNPEGRKIAEFFWNTVVHHRTWVIGGNSDHEHFFPVGKAGEHLGPATAESCNTYNMLKLTEHLLAWNPTVERADYYERALFNHILGTQEPKKGMFTYFMSFKSGHFKTFSTPENSFWCCVGSGMENHTKYGEAIYLHGDDSLYLNLFIPSVLAWKDRGLVLRQSTNFPNEDFTGLAFEEAPAAPLRLFVRCPGWTASPVTFLLNGKRLEVKATPGQYTEITRLWAKGDHLRVTLPMAIRTEKLEGDPRKVAFLYGPIALAGVFGPVPESATFPYAEDHTKNFRVAGVDVPVLVPPTAGADPAAFVKRLPGTDLAFRTSGLTQLGQPEEITLRPYASIFYEFYNLYWNVLRPGEWKDRQAEMRARQERRKQEEARTVDEFFPGEQQSEMDHHVESERSRTGDFRDRKWRDASEGGWFEFRMKALRDIPLVLRCTYWGDDDRREFDILVDGQQLATQKLRRNEPEKFFDVEYAIPAEFLTGKADLTIRFQPRPGSIAGGLFKAVLLKSHTSHPPQ